MRDNRSNKLLSLAGWCAYASAVVSIVGIVFLVLMFIGFFTDNKALQKMGPLNDICIIIQYLLALPIALARHQLLKAQAPVLSRAAMLIGITGVIAIVGLQFLLVAGVLTFEEQVGPVMIALLVVGVWLVLTGYLGHSTGKLPRGRLRSVLGLLHLGYPFWAFWLGRLLLSGKVTLAEPGASLKGELV